MDLLDLILRMALATVVGGVIGLERELRDRNAGFRTHILVCVGATAFTIVSAYGFESFLVSTDPAAPVDPSRVAAQIVTGIGFLGAGAIIRHGGTVRGLTTAANLWALAAIGMAIGLGLYAVTFVTAAAVLISLTALRIIEHRVIEPRIANGALVNLHFSESGLGNLGPVVQFLDDSGVILRSMEVDEDDEEHHVRLRVRMPRDMDHDRLRRLIEDLGVTDETEVT